MNKQKEFKLSIKDIEALHRIFDDFFVFIKTPYSVLGEVYHKALISRFIDVCKDRELALESQSLLIICNIHFEESQQLLYINNIEIL